MNSIQIETCFLLIMFTLFSSHSKAQREAVSVIPQPLELKILEGNYEITSQTSLVYDFSDEELTRISGFLSKHLEDYYHLRPIRSRLTKKGIRLKISQSLGLADEGYSIKVDGNGILVTATTAKGILYGVQTLKQMLSLPSSGKLYVPYAEIKDQPRFGWRGLMLDVGRHFYPVSYIKTLLDYMAMYKLNTFHWHLTEDQGWRIEIKKYPKLIELSHWRDETIMSRSGGHEIYDGIGYGGFYTQDQIKEIIQYASDRFITVVPEIEMPGHSSAALAAYPKLGCTGGPYEVQKTWGVKKDVYCPGKEETFRFLQDIMDEVCELFPSTYIHIGGDECPKDRWKECPDCQKRIQDERLQDEHELQSYFIRRMEKYLILKNKKLIGWDEILEGGLAPEATVMSWRGIRGGIEAAKQGHDVVMSPTTHCYFDYPQDEGNKMKPNYLPLEKVYDYEPVPEELDTKEASHILGTQANVWTESIANTKKLEYMAFPRICALSEVAWSSKETRNFLNFQRRMEMEYLRLEMYNINYYRYP